MGSKTLRQIRIKSSSLILKFLSNIFVFTAMYYTKRTSYLRYHFTNRSNDNKSNSGVIKILYLVPPDTKKRDNWDKARGNLHYEITQSAMERFGPNSIIIYNFLQNISFDVALVEIAQLIESKNIDIVMGFPEDGPYLNSWRWDEIVYLLKDSDTKFIGILLDSVHKLIQFRVKYLEFINSKAAFLAIDEIPLHFKRAVGPVFLPISNESLEVIKEEVIKAKFQSSNNILNFSGKLYPNRISFLNKINSKVATVSVNSHLELNNCNENDYLSYLRSLYSGRINLYLTKNSILNTHQLKSRALELSVLGKPILSDNIGYLDLFFIENKHFFVFDSLEELSSIVSNLDLIRPYDHDLSDLGFELAQNNFWINIETLIKLIQL